MKGDGTSRRQASSGSSSEALSAVIAHELNNIAVPLSGFIELALETAASDDLVRQSLKEVHIGMDRIAALARELESLAQHGSMPTAATIGECIAPIEQGNSAVPLIWSCSPQTPVKVDLDQARRAIDSLLRLAGTGPLAIAESAMNGLSCAACGKAFPRGKVFAQVQARGVRPATLGAIRAPFDAAHKLRSMQRVTIAALVHCAHLAGCHVIARLEAESLGIVMPT